VFYVVVDQTVNVKAPNDVAPSDEVARLTKKEK
jgi:hypothetical protein